MKQAEDLLNADVLGSARLLRQAAGRHTSLVSMRPPVTHPAAASPTDISLSSSLHQVSVLTANFNRLEFLLKERLLKSISASLQFSAYGIKRSGINPPSFNQVQYSFQVCR